MELGSLASVEVLFRSHSVFHLIFLPAFPPAEAPCWWKGRGAHARSHGPSCTPASPEPPLFTEALYALPVTPGRGTTGHPAVLSGLPSTYVPPPLPPETHLFASPPEGLSLVTLAPRLHAPDSDPDGPSLPPFCSLSFLSSIFRPPPRPHLFFFSPY